MQPYWAHDTLSRVQGEVCSLEPSSTVKKKRRKKKKATGINALPPLLLVHVVDQLVPQVDQGDQLLQQQLLAVLVGLALLPLWGEERTDRRNG